MNVRARDKHNERHVTSVSHLCHKTGCNRLKCPPVRLSDIQCYNMCHNGHGINLYGVIMITVGNLHAGVLATLACPPIENTCILERMPQPIDYIPVS